MSYRPLLCHIMFNVIVNSVFGEQSYTFELKFRIRLVSSNNKITSDTTNWVESKKLMGFFMVKKRREHTDEKVWQKETSPD